MRMVLLFHSEAAALTGDDVLAACDGLDQTDDVLPTLGAPMRMVLLFHSDCTALKASGAAISSCAHASH
jgi:hypothetical protein